MLAHVRSLLDGKGLRAVYVDATVIAEAPKLGPAPRRDARAAGRGLGVPEGSVNVKFTTNERMGPIGRGEGMAAMAVATVDDA